MKKKKFSIAKLFIAIFLIIIGVLLFPKKVSHPDFPQICYKSYCYTIEIANTPQLRQDGLMNREFLGETSGMIFIFEDENTHKFWMKNTLIPLDMIRLSSGLQVIDIVNAIPCKQEICPTYGPNTSSKYVLEINGGLSSKIGLEIGDIMKKKGDR